MIVYSNVADYNWRAILPGFKAKYPWIQIVSGDMGPAIAFERYYAEAAAHRPTADLMIVGAPDAWIRFAQKGAAYPYVSPESGSLPNWSKPFSGIYTFSADPMIIIYNKALLRPNEYPASVGQMLALGSANPGRFSKKFTTYDASSHPFAYAIQWAAVHFGKPGGWDFMQKLSPYVRTEEAGASMLDKVTSGEYFAAYYTSSITVWPNLTPTGRGRIVGWAYPKDGTPVIMRGMAITRATQSPNSAKLLLDYLLSHEGAVAEGKGGLTPYRHDVRRSEVPNDTLDAVVSKVGAKNIVPIGYDKAMIDEYKPFIARWNILFHGAGR